MTKIGGWFTVLVLSLISGQAYSSCDNCQESCTNGTCLNCDPGHYNLQGSCILCTPNCDVCNNATSCETCSIGYWRNTTGHCSNCPDTCKKCNSDRDCRICKTGYYPVRRQCTKCPTNCLACTSQNRCYTCKDGFWGPTCTDTCPDICVNNTCTLYGYCYNCPEGLFGILCEYPCPDNCANDRCSSGSGMCLDGCVGGFYEFHCVDACPGNCLNNVCDFYTGNCKGCHNGYYGKICNETCIAKNCQSNECFQNNGSCVEKCPDNCISCYSISNCSACKPGFFGSGCEEICNTNCLPDIDGQITCSTTTGSCSDCKAGFYGHDCSIACSEGCELDDNLNTTSCNKTDGSCTNGCMDGYTGLKCIEALTGNDVSADDYTWTIVGITLGCIALVGIVIVVVGVLLIRRKTEHMVEQ